MEREDVSEVLREEGYVEIQLGRILSIFQMRYRAYMNGSKIFPHEMGLLLGYPVEDVTGFMVLHLIQVKYSKVKRCQDTWEARELQFKILKS